jgi:hypothetical protein
MVERGKKMLGAAEVALTFLADCRDEDDRPTRGQPLAVDRFGEGEHGGDTARVVDDARSAEMRSILRDGDGHPAREDGVEMRAHDDSGVGGRTGADAPYVADGVEVDAVKTERTEPIGDVRTARGFVAGGSGYFRDGNLRRQQALVARREPRGGVRESADEGAMIADCRGMVGAHTLSIAETGSGMQVSTYST